MKRIIAASLIATAVASSAFAGPVIKSQAPVQPKMSSQSSAPGSLSPLTVAIGLSLLAILAVANHGGNSTPSTT